MNHPQTRIKEKRNKLLNYNKGFNF